MGLTQRDLINERYYERLLNDVESGLVAPSRDFLEYLADSLETTIEEFVGYPLATSAALNPAVTPVLPVNTEASSQERALMNAHIQVETGQPAAALSFLQPHNPEETPVELKGVFYRVRGYALLSLRRFQEAEADLEKALALFEEFQPTHIFQIEITRNLIGLNFYRQNQIKEALKYHQQCLEAVTSGQITNPRFRLMLFSNLANEYYLLGKWELALAIYKKDALPLAEQGEDDLLVAAIFWGAGLAFQSGGELGQAALCLDRSVHLYRKQEAWHLAVQVQDQLGLLFIRRKDYKLAEEVLLSALSLVETMDEPRIRAFVNLNTAYLYSQIGELNRAIEFVETSIKIGRDLGDALLLGQTLNTLAEIKMAQNEPEIAFQVYEEAISLLSQTDQLLILENVMQDYADALKSQGHLEKALEIRFKMRQFA